jgi:transposase-like protein
MSAGKALKNHSMSDHPQEAKDGINANEPPLPSHAPLSPEERKALKADIRAYGVKVRIDVDEEGTIIDGHQRQQICDELGIECPRRVLAGLTEEEKLEHALRLNLKRRHLSPEQKRELARTWREQGWTQKRIAQALGVAQPTIANWLREFIKSDKLPSTVQGKDGKAYPPKKQRRRTAHPAEVNRPETPQSPSDAGDGPAQEPEQPEPPQPRDTPAEAWSPSSEPPAAVSVPDALERLALVSAERQTAPRAQPNSALESGPGPSPEDDAAAHWVNALQDLTPRLETLLEQGRRLPPSADWAPDIRARGVAACPRMQEMLIDLASVVGAETGEAANQNVPVDDVTPALSRSAITDGAQDRENGEGAPAASAAAPIDAAMDAEQPASERDGDGKPPPDQESPAREDATSSPPERPAAPGTPASARARRTTRAMTDGHGADHPERRAPDHTAAGNAPSTGEGAIDGVPRPQPDERMGEAAADAGGPERPLAPADGAEGVPGDPTRCGWCGGTQFLPVATESGRIYCECHAAYDPSTGRWTPGDRDKRHSAPGSEPAPGAVTLTTMEDQPSEATAGSAAGGHTATNGH